MIENSKSRSSPKAWKTQILHNLHGKKSSTKKVKIHEYWSIQIYCNAKNTLIISVHQRRGFFSSFKHKGSSHVVTRWLVECLLPNSVLAYGGPCSLKGTFVSRRNKMQCRGPRRAHRAAKDSRQAPCGHFCPKGQDQGQSVQSRRYSGGNLQSAVHRYLHSFFLLFTTLEEVNKRLNFHLIWIFIGTYFPSELEG